MKVVHVPFCYWPDPVGGTGVYVESVAKQQQQQGLQILVAAPSELNQAYSYSGLKVRRFPVTQRVQDVADLYGEGDALAAEAFGRILDDERPDLVHLHAFTYGASLRLVREAKKREIPVIFNYHTPTVSCQRGTLMRWGSEACDGILDVTRCTRCTLHGHGMSRLSSVIAGSIPSAVGRALGAMRASGGVWTAARMTELVRVRQNAFRCLMAEVDHIIALCQWVKDVLLRNGVPGEKITVSRQGLCQSDDNAALHSLMSSEREAGLRIAFLGRLDPTKGAHILIHALKQAPELRVELDIYGIAQGAAGAAYLRSLKQLAAGDRRVAFRDPLPSQEIVTRLREYDVLAVPSQGLETGPMVILEAYAARVPVIGSNLGGIAELVTHGVDGLLVDPHSVEAWRGVIEESCSDRDSLNSLRVGIRPPRRIREVAAEMATLYASCCEKAPSFCGLAHESA